MSTPTPPLTRVSSGRGTGSSGPLPTPAYPDVNSSAKNTVHAKGPYPPFCGTGLERRGTTRELIGRFEALGGPDVEQLDSGGVGKGRRRGDTFSVSVAKGRSPIRQSIRSFLSVFKKSASKLDRLSPSPPSPPLPTLAQQVRERSQSTGGLERALTREEAEPVNFKAGGREATPALSLQIPSVATSATTAAPTSAVEAAKNPEVCLSPVEEHKGHAGDVLYLSRLPASGADAGAKPLPAVWVPCTAQLHRSHILLVARTRGGNPAPRLVPFVDCVDVRSLAQGEVTRAERALLPGCEGEGEAGAGVGAEEMEWRVFELTFEGRARERFAVRGLSARATWVSRLW